jgi:hypothetical protein
VHGKALFGLPLVAIGANDSAAFGTLVVTAPVTDVVHADDTKLDALGALGVITDGTVEGVGGTDDPRVIGCCAELPCHPLAHVLGDVGLA